MSYLEGRLMEGNAATGLEFQQLSSGEKESLLRAKLATYQDDISERGLKELTVTLLHPEVLIEQNMQQPRLPIQHGRLIGITPDIAAGRRNRIKFVKIDLTGTTPINDSYYAQVGLGAVEISTSGQIFIDCTRLESPHGAAQGIFPQNTFVEKPPK